MLSWNWGQGHAGPCRSRSLSHSLLGWSLHWRSRKIHPWRITVGIILLSWLAKHSVLFELTSASFALFCTSKILGYPKISYKNHRPSVVCLFQAQTLCWGNVQPTRTARLLHLGCDGCVCSKFACQNLRGAERRSSWNRKELHTSFIHAEEMVFKRWYSLQHSKYKLRSESACMCSLMKSLNSFFLSRKMCLLSRPPDKFHRGVTLD